MQVTVSEFHALSELFPPAVYSHKKGFNEKYNRRNSVAEFVDPWLGD